MNYHLRKSVKEVYIIISQGLFISKQWSCTRYSCKISSNPMRFAEFGELWGSSNNLARSTQFECPWALPCADYIKIKCLVSASGKYYRCPSHYLQLQKVSNVIVCDKYVNFTAVIMQAPSREGCAMCNSSAFKLSWGCIQNSEFCHHAMLFSHQLYFLCMNSRQHWTFYSEITHMDKNPISFQDGE